ncbi:hypothetical protein FJ951_12910 [Mesorhizobium sp. B2-2-3]|uniref:DUF6882 domain-containing protein n=1 Tax=Mesorhizobium sp. B2-2-3 TaxID=2589963 RepID=UPI00112967F0|nr:DUF6882 domain-containing protein [Mesorhizobium sp. B2-2-3]TPM47266.1 hypothetical protein FJ951_12910 [Mesorhizobium sp. B2-2-3]
MKPNWYSAWRAEAIKQLKTKNKRLEEEFRIGHWSRYDLSNGKLLFSKDGAIEVITEIQIAGSTNAKAQNWLWAWANSNLPDSLLRDAKLVRSFGEKNGIDELAQAYVIDGNQLEVLGWELAAVTVRICDAVGAYRSPRGEGGALYYIFKTINWAN